MVVPPRDWCPHRSSWWAGAPCAQAEAGGQQLRAHHSCTGDSTGRPGGLQARARSRARGRLGAGGRASSDRSRSACCSHRCTPDSPRGWCGRAAGRGTCEPRTVGLAPAGPSMAAARQRGAGSPRLRAGGGAGGSRGEPTGKGLQGREMGGRHQVGDHLRSHCEPAEQEGAPLEDRTWPPQGRVPPSGSLDPSLPLL